VRLHTAEWNDDFHNVAHVIATGETEGYYIDFAEDRWGKLARALAEGFAYQGEHSRHQDAPRGVPSGHLPPVAFVDFLQNHDQIGNRAFGERLVGLAPTALLEALTAVLLLSPHIPLIFMGEEWGERRPFAFFTDFHGELADAVREGRRREFRHFAAFLDPGDRAEIPDPNEETTFTASKIDWDARASKEGRAWLELFRRLLAVRHGEVVPRLGRAPGHGGKVIAAADGVLAIDWRLDGATLRLRANLGDVEGEAPAAAGRVIYASEGAGGEGRLPSFAVRFALDDA
jgi:malto-oligosyltrehalose trehalohydrolase